MCNAQFTIIPSATFCHLERSVEDAKSKGLDLTKHSPLRIARALAAPPRDPRQAWGDILFGIINDESYPFNRVALVVVIQVIYTQLLHHR